MPTHPVPPPPYTPNANVDNVARPASDPPSAEDSLSTHSSMPELISCSDFGDDNKSELDLLADEFIYSLTFDPGVHVPISDLNAPTSSQPSPPWRQRAGGGEGARHPNHRGQQHRRRVRRNGPQRHQGVRANVARREGLLDSLEHVPTRRRRNQRRFFNVMLSRLRSIERMIRESDIPYADWF